MSKFEEFMQKVSKIRSLLKIYECVRVKSSKYFYDFQYEFPKHFSLKRISHVCYNRNSMYLYQSQSSFMTHHKNLFQISCFEFRIRKAPENAIGHKLC